MKIIFTICLCLIFIKCNDDKSKDFSQVDWNVKKFLASSFNLTDSSNYSISFTNKAKFKEKITHQFQNAPELIDEKMNSYWKNTIKIMIDSIKIPINESKYTVINFIGDTSKYEINEINLEHSKSRKTYFGKGKKYLVENLKMNKRHGKETFFYTSGNIKDQKNYRMGKQIDTTFSYWENGQIAGMYLDDGEGGYTKSKCFNSDGSDCSCDDMDIEVCK